MFYCPLHNWTSYEEPCPACHPHVTTTVSNYIVNEQPEVENKGGLIGVSIKGNVVDYENSASLKLGEDGLPTAIAMNGIIFLPEQSESKDVFTWDELKEFYRYVTKQGYGYDIPDERLSKLIENFEQQSKQPIKPDTNERIEVLTEDNEQWVKLPLDAFNEAIKKAERDAWNFAREKMIIDGKPTERQYRFLSFYDYEIYEKTNETLYQKSLQSNSKTYNHVQ